MAEFRFEVEDREPREQLRRLSLFLSDLRGFWPLVVPLFHSWMTRQFESEGGFAGDPWAPLSERYGIWKHLHFPGKTILQREGGLRRAATMTTRQVTPRTLTLTIRDPKIAYHQEGTPRMPRRPLVFERLPPVAQRELELASERYVESLLARV